MDKRVLLTTVVSMALVLGYVLFFAKKPAPQQQPQQQQQQQAPTANPTAADAAKQAAAAKPAEPATAGPPAPPAPKATPVETTIEQPKLYKAIFTSEGAAPKSWVLLDPQYKEDNPKATSKQAEPIDLVRRQVPNLPLEVTFPSSGFSLPPDAVWSAEPRGADGALVYTWEQGDVRVTKRFVPVPNSYQVQVTVTVENKGDKPLSHYFQVQMHGYQDPSIKPGGWLSRRVPQTTGVCYIGGKIKKGNLEELNKEQINELGKVTWVGIGEQYFLQAVALPPSDEQRRCNVFAAPDGSISSILTLASHEAPAHGKTEYQMVAFMGPKILAQLDAVQVAGQPGHLGDVMEYPLMGLTEWLARPMLVVLKAIHFVIPSWGIAIIVLTILVKLLTWYPTQKSMKSMKAMAKLKPEMDKLKARFGDDKNALNMATMELYKKHGVNPLGGCLPILIQMPVYIALYSMLGNSVELYRSPFLWIRDLTAPDPYYILPLLTGALMFLQQKTQPTPPDPQQKGLMYAMPVMFTVFNLVWPAGLTIYILTNTILTFLQQLWMNRGDKPARPKAVASKPARA
jgi:YidC/Oxa1 family membrane protein insertase